MKNLGCLICIVIFLMLILPLPEKIAFIIAMIIVIFILSKRDASEDLISDKEKDGDVEERKESKESVRNLAEDNDRKITAQRAAKRVAFINGTEAEEKAKKEAEEKARKEAEEKARKIAEEKVRKEAEEKARKEAEEKARKEAEEKARKIAEEKVRKEAEEKTRKEAEKRPEKKPKRRPEK